MYIVPDGGWSVDRSFQSVILLVGIYECRGDGSDGAEGLGAVCRGLARVDGGVIHLTADILHKRHS